VLSTDSAHSLGDSLDVRLGPEPVEVAPNLWGQETDVYYNLQKYFGTVQAWLSALLAWRGVDEVLAEEMAVIPGMEEISNLLWINRHHEEGQFDVIVVDCAPTAETLRLLAFPEDARWWLERILPVQRRVARLVNPIIGTMTGMPTPDDEVFLQAEYLFHQLDKLQDLLSNTKLASVRLVMNPEHMVIREAQRTFTYLNLYSYSVDMVICNRVLPEQVHDAYFDRWHAIQKQHLTFIQEAFSPVPIRQVPLMPQEVVGTAALQRIADALFTGEDPTTIYYEGTTQTVRKLDGSYVLDLHLPFVEKGDISVLKRGDELTVHVGAYRRNIVLPHVLASLSPGTAKFQNEVLRIPFAAAQQAADT